MLAKREAQRISMHRIRNLPNNIQINVQSDVMYRNYLAALKFDFEDRLKRVPLSMDTGLKGFEEFRIIGSGSFGDVKVVRDPENKFYAVKIMLKSRIVFKDKVKSVMNEKSLLYAFRFPFVLWLIWSRKDNVNIYLGLPLLSGGELFTLHSRHEYFSEEQARFYAVQVVLAFEYLHYLRVIYRDLKLENLVLDREGYIRLTDFGFAKRVEHRTMSLCGTPEYLSPEVLTATPYFSGPDWWAFGVLVYEMCHGETPFTNYLLDTQLMYSQILRAEYDMPAKFSEPLKSLIKRFLVIDLTKRFGCLLGGADDVKRHEWFKTVNWFSYLRKEIKPPFVPNITNSLDTRYFNTPKPRKKSKTPSAQNSFSEHFEDF